MNERDPWKELNELKGAFFKEQSDHAKTKKELEFWMREALRLKVILYKIADAEVSE